jgi:outer membrane immunogenic protein
MAVAVACVLASSARADGVYYGAPARKAVVYEPPFTWTGFYIGLHGGYGAAEMGLDSTGLALGRDWSLQEDGAFLGGAQAGFNLQMGTLVLGLEADGGWLSAEASKNGAVIASLCGPLLNSFAQIETGAYAALSARAGLSLGMLLLYVKAGAAWADVKARYADSDPVAGQVVSASTRSETMTGWVAGVGAEWAFTAHWAAKVEYLHLGFGDLTLAGLSTVANGRLLHNDLAVDTVKVGLNYRF